MKKHLLRAFFSLSLLGLIFLVSACSVEISQTQLVPTRTAAPPTDTPAPTLPPTDTPTQPPTLTPTATQPGDPTATASPTPTPTAPFLFPTVEADLQNFAGQSAAGLQGRMIFLATLSDGTQAVLAFEPATGTLSTLFATEPNSKAWILSASVASDNSGILLSYAPPPPPGKPSYGYTDQYVLRPDGQLDPVLLRTEDVEAMFGSFFTPAMDYVYYSYFFADSTAPSGFRYHIYRVGYPTGTPELVVENAYWERMSADGTKMAYVTFGNQDYDEMFVSDADGSNPVRVLDPAQFPTIDAPFFSPDNQYLYFSAVDSGTPTPLAWWEKLMGVHIASAHTVPSDFWRVSLADGSAQQITDLKAQGMFGAFSPDGTQIAFITSSGLYVMQPDGSELVQLLEASTLYGNIEWVP